MYKSIMKILLPLILVCFLFRFAGAQDRTTPDQWFDSYGVIPWNEEKLHLDNFAHHLRQNADQIGYLIYFVGKGNDVARVAQRCRRAQKFLSRQRHIRAARIVIKYAGRSDETRFILQPISKSLQPPTFRNHETSSSRKPPK